MIRQKIIHGLLITCLIPTSFVATSLAVVGHPFTMTGCGDYSITSNTLAKSPSFTPFTHNYHSMSADNQDHYYPDVTRENINLIHMLRNNGSYQPYDWTFDRFRNVFYNSNTFVNIYDLDNNPISDGQYQTYSVNSSWEGSNGFAYLASNSNDEHANTYYNFFAGDRNLAMYFDSGNDIFTDKCTYESLKEFVDNAKNVDNHTLSLNLSTLLANDLDRDNAILSLLNPCFWDAILSALSDFGQTYDVDFQLSLIDLSNNDLRIVPNIASIPNKNQDGWMFDDTNSYPNVTLGMNTIATDLNRHIGITQDGCIQNIDLSHNAISYLNMYAYRNFDSDHNWVPNPYLDPTVVSQRADIYNELTDYPSLLTLVACRYESYTDAGSLTALLDGTYQHTRTGYGGVNIDYNHIPYFAMLFTNEESDLGEPSYFQTMMHSWQQPTLFDLFGTYIEFSYARAYLTYTTANYYDSSSYVYLVEYVFGMGAYQTDAFVSTADELAHFVQYGTTYSLLPYAIKQDFDLMNTLYPKNLFPSQIVNSFSTQDNLFVNLMQDFIAMSGCQSLQLDHFVVPSHIISPKDFKDENYPILSDDFTGQIQLTYISQYTHANYTPSYLKINNETNFNEIANQLLSLVSLYHYQTYVFEGYAHSNNILIEIGIVYLIVFTIFVILLTHNIVTGTKKVLKYRKTKKS